MESTITVKGQATIPKAIRVASWIEARDRIKFFFHPDGSVAILPKIPPSRLRGMLKRRNGKTVSVEDMNRAIAKAAAAAVPRSRCR